MAFSMQGGGPLRAEINITPMIDVLLVLIIVFMVVVAMSKETRRSRNQQTKTHPRQRSTPTS
jgi:biopolymer transport protein ExbD